MIRLYDSVRGSYLRKFAVLTLATLVVMAGAGVVMQRQVAAELREETHGKLETTAEIESNELGTWVEEHEHTTRLLSEAVRPRLDRDDPEQYLSAELEHLPETTHADHVVDTGANTVVATTQGSERSERYTRVEFESASGSETDVVMSDPYVEDSRELLAFASVVPGRERAVVVTAELDALASHLHSPIEGGETSVVAADSRTTVLSSNVSGTLTAFSGYLRRSGAEATARSGRTRTERPWVRTPR